MTTDVVPKSDTAKFSAFLDRLKPQLERALPAHLNADRMSRLALTAFSTNAKLRECSAESIAASIMTAAQLGLEPGVNGAGYLIPYKGTCTFVPGWKGLVDLVSRSGRGTVYTGVIFSDQTYTYTDGATRDLVIHNESDLFKPEDITHAFAIGWVVGATRPVIELWSVKKIRNHRDQYNKVGDRHYSFRDWEMYCRKVPLLQVLKYMPSSIELSNAIAVSNAAESGRGATIENGVVVDFGNFDWDDVNQAQAQEEPAGLPFCPENEFAKNWPLWEKVVHAGKKTPQEIIDSVSANWTLSPTQQAQILTLKPAKKKDDEPIVTFAVLAEKISKATDADILDAHADLIGEVDNASEREELGRRYKAKRKELLLGEQG